MLASILVSKSVVALIAASANSKKHRQEEKAVARPSKASASFVCNGQKYASRAKYDWYTIMS